MRYERNQALLNGALIALGTVAVLDNVLAHWTFDLHRLVSDARVALPLEAALVAIGIALLTWGLRREFLARRSP